MSNELEPKTNSDHPVVYQIRIKGHLGSQWTDWFEGLTITLEEDGDTLLTGPVIDQAALHGLLKKVRDLGLPLISVSLLNPARQIRHISSRQEQLNETHSYRPNKGERNEHDQRKSPRDK
jgi:hypothetical protein